MPDGRGQPQAVRKKIIMPGPPAAQWLSEHKVGVAVEEAIAKLIRMNPRPNNPIEVLGSLLIDCAHEKGAPYIESPRGQHVATSEPAVEAHQQSEVDDNVATLRACANDVLATMGGVTIRCTKVTSVPKDIPSGAKLVHFIRHGEGTHNVAQREWRADPQWDGKSECVACLDQMQPSVQMHRGVSHKLCFLCSPTRIAATAVPPVPPACVQAVHDRQRPGLWFRRRGAQREGSRAGDSPAAGDGQPRARAARRLSHAPRDADRAARLRGAH